MTAIDIEGVRRTVIVAGFERLVSAKPRVRLPAASLRPADAVPCHAVRDSVRELGPVIRRQGVDLAHDIVDGAREAGLNVDAMPTSRIFEIVPDHRAPLQNVSAPTDPTFMQKAWAWAWVWGLAKTGDRTPGPEHLHEVHVSAKLRWLDLPQNLAGGEYRPATLDRVAEALNALDPKAYGVDKPLLLLDDAELYEMYEVRPRDTLAAIAERRLGSEDRAGEIFEANLDKMEMPSQLRAGETIRIPRGV